MDTTQTDRSLALMKGLNEALSSLQSGQYDNQALQASLIRLASLFGSEHICLLEVASADAATLHPLISCWHRDQDWQSYPYNNNSDQRGLVLAPEQIAHLSAGKLLSLSMESAQLSELLHNQTGPTVWLYFIPVLPGKQLDTSLCLLLDQEEEPIWTEADNTILITYANALGSWLDIYRADAALTQSGMATTLTDILLLNRKIVTTIPDQIFIIDLHNQTNLYSNRPVFLGYDLSLIENPFEFFQKLIHPDDFGPAFENFFEKLFAATDDEIIESEYRMFTKEGEVIWFNERVKVFKRDENEQVWQYLVLLQDVTARTLALQAEEESQRRYRNFVTYSSDGIYYMNCGKPIPIDLPVEEQVSMYYEHGFIEEANPVIAKMYGLASEQELIGQRIYDLHKGEHFEKNQQSFVDFVHNGYRIVDVETIESDKNGRLLYFLNNAVGMITDGKLLGIWGTQQNITDRKEAEQAKKESDLLFRSLYEINPLGVAISDWKGTILRTNDVFHHMLGYTPGELTGVSYIDITHPDEVAREVKQFREIIRTRPPSVSFEKRYMHKHGQVVWATVNMSFLYTDDGKIRFVIAMVEDVTESRKIRLALEQSESLQNAILNTLPDLKFRIDKDGHYIGYYPSPDDQDELLVSAEKFLGKQISEFMPTYISDAILKNIEQAIASREVQQLEYALPINGELRYYEARINAINDEEVIAVVRNVSERTWAQTQLREKVRELDIKNRQLKKYIDSNMQLENFAYIASHDLREPLRTMGTFAQLLQKRFGEQLDETANTYIDFIVDGSLNMNNLIEDLLTFSRVETQEGDRENINLPKLLDQVIHNLRDVVEANQATIDIRTLPPSLYANPTKVKQLFQNLLVNAIKFRQPDIPPHIIIDSSNLGSYWQFSIQDNGIGIDPDFHEKIFLLFKKLHTRQDFQGTGLGLAICKKIVEQLGGDIWVESRPQAGSTFFFTVRTPPSL